MKPPDGWELLKAGDRIKVPYQWINPETNKWELCTDECFGWTGETWSDLLVPMARKKRGKRNGK